MRDFYKEIMRRIMQTIGRKYPYCGYGGMFWRWMFSDDPKPYNSFGNGSAMRISPVGFIAKDVEEAKELSRKVTEIIHNHPEGIKGKWSQGTEAREMKSWN